AVFFLLRGRFPFWIEHGGTLPQIGDGIAVTIEAPSHRQRLGLAHQRHAADGTMTRRAADPLGNMNRMIEIDIIGKDIDALPVDGPILRETRAHRLQHLSLRIELRVAGHASLGRGTPATADRSTDEWQ